MDGFGKAGLGCKQSGIFFLRDTCRESKETYRFTPGVDLLETSQWRGSQSRRCLDIRVGS